MSSYKVNFLPCEIIDALDINKRQELIDDNKLLEINFTVSAWTKHASYGPREFDDYDAEIISSTWDLSVDVKETIKSYIINNSNVGCDDGKQPDISLSGMLKECGEIDIDYDRFVGFASLNGYVWVWIL